MDTIFKLSTLNPDTVVLFPRCMIGAFFHVFRGGFACHLQFQRDKIRCIRLKNMCSKIRVLKKREWRTLSSHWITSLKMGRGTSPWCRHPMWPFSRAPWETHPAGALGSRPRALVLFQKWPELTLRDSLVCVRHCAHCFTVTLLSRRY